MASLLPSRTLPLTLVLMVTLAPGAAVFNISGLSGLLAPALTESLLVALPPCHLTGGNATLTVRRANDSTVLTRGFVVPACRGRRELVSVVDSGAGFTVTRLSAYQVTGLAPGTKYYVSYRVRKGAATESSREVPVSTLPRREAASIGLGMARTGGMVVITVLLSVAMFLLVLGLIVALALGARNCRSQRGELGGQSPQTHREPQAGLVCRAGAERPQGLGVDVRLQRPDLWAGLHGQVPGLLDWDMGNECFLACSTAHLPAAEQNLARYRLRVVEPPPRPVRKSPAPDGDGPDIEPNLWMWVNPNIVFPPGKLEVSQPRTGAGPTSTRPAPPLPPGEGDCARCPQAGVGGRPPASSGRSPPPEQPPAPSSSELAEEEAEDQHDGSSVALPSPHQRAPLQSPRLRRAGSQEGRPWPRPPLNYFHLIALALRNSAPCGLHVQQIYSFTRQHFPFFRTAPEGWKNTVRHNLCFRDSFEKVPAARAGWPRACLWRLTAEGRRRFRAEARALAAAQRARIRQCMSRPDEMASLFDL